MKLLVFHNPNAGHTDVRREVLVAELQRAGHEVIWIEKNGTTRLDAVLAQPLGAAVVVGGDGSVGAVGRKLAGRDIPIAVLPAGTANNIATLLGATEQNLIPLLERGQTLPFDVGVLEGAGQTRRFLEGVGVGAFADTAALLSARAEAGEQTVDGREDELDRDLHVLAEQVRRVEPSACEMEVDGREVSGDFLLVEITNAGLIGPNLRLSPGAVPGDGWLDVTAVDVTEREELLAFIAGRRRSPDAVPAFASRRAQRVRLHVPGGCTLHIDGDTIDLDGPADLRIRIEPAALRFFAAPSAFLVPSS